MKNHLVFIVITGNAAKKAYRTALDRPVKCLTCCLAAVADNFIKTKDRCPNVLKRYCRVQSQIHFPSRL